MALSGQWKSLPFCYLLLGNWWNCLDQEVNDRISFEPSTLIMFPNLNKKWFSQLLCAAGNKKKLQSVLTMWWREIKNHAILLSFHQKNLNNTYVQHSDITLVIKPMWYFKEVSYPSAVQTPKTQKNWRIVWKNLQEASTRTLQVLTGWIKLSCDSLQLSKIWNELLTSHLH